MDTLESLAASIKTTEGIQSIVRTMKTLSAASIHQYESAADAIAKYSDTVDQGLQVVLRDRPLRSASWQSAAGADRRSAVIVIGSDRGLCGRFNDRIASFASAHLLRAQAGGDKPLLGVMGIRAVARLSTEGHDADQTIALPGSAGGLTHSAQEVITFIARLIRTEGVTQIDLMHNSRNLGTGSSPIARRLMPVAESYLEGLAQKPWPSRRLPMFRMDTGALRDWLLREHFFVTIYRSLAESLASEHASRLASMQNAEHNIGDRQEELQASFRQKRQESITRELLDLIIGFEVTQPPDQNSSTD